MWRGVSRRAFLAAGVAAIATAGRATAQPKQARTRLVLLGTAGGPTPKVSRAAPAFAVAVDDRVYLVDCGDGVARQLALAKLPVRQLRAVFVTHQHSDHNAGYGPLFLLGWTAGLAQPVDTYGPPPLVEMTRLLFDAYKFDIDLRMKDEGRAPLVPLVRPHEITSGGEIFKDDLVRVSATLNEHPPIEHSFAYRFDTPDRSIVFSGDTGMSKNVIAMAKSADVLVHEVTSRAYWERGDAPQSKEVIRHILASHTDVADAARVASSANVKTLVLAHFVPTEGPNAPSDDQWLAAARPYFNGTIVIGKDLMVL